MGEELWCPNLDVCAWCGDSECDGIGCIAGLDPDDPGDHEAIERLHHWLRVGRLHDQMEGALAEFENRAPVVTAVGAERGQDDE